MLQVYFGQLKFVNGLKLAVSKDNLARCRRIVRKHLQVQRFDDDGRIFLRDVIQSAAHTMGSPADLINLAIEILIQQRYLLPAFSTLDRLINHWREAVHKTICQQIYRKLSKEQKATLDELLVLPSGAYRTPFTKIKLFPPKATLGQIRQWEIHLGWLEDLMDTTALLEGIAQSKIKEFAAHAHALEVGDMLDVTGKTKRYSFLLCLLNQAQTHTRDQLTTMFLKRMRRIHQSGRDKLKALKYKHRGITEQMVETLHHIAVKAPELESDQAFGQYVRQILQTYGGSERLLEHYETVAAYHNDNYLPLMWGYYKSHRAVLFRISHQLRIRAATQDDLVLAALQFIQAQQHKTRDYWPDQISLDFASDRWQREIRTKQNGEAVLNRRMLELCVFTYLSRSIQSGDIYIEESEEFADYRAQLLPWDECQKQLHDYCDSLGLSNTAAGFVQSLRKQLTELAQQVDDLVPDNADLSFDKDGRPHLKKTVKRPIPSGVNELKEEIKARMPERNLLDILKHTNHWADFTSCFGPSSGAEPKMIDVISRYLLVIFGYGCNLGPAQLVRHARKFISTRIMQRINRQHVTSAKLEKAINRIVRQYIRFPLPFYWGKGKSVITDGTQFDLRDNNLMGSYHVRYGRFGGIAYHHISDTYIALFSQFIHCGVWEAVYIIDGLLQNESELQPDIVHADTQGQSESVFGLAHLLGIKLMPRMRTWNKVAFYRPDTDTSFKHLDTLFTRVINWDLIETHWQDLMQVILSIRAGTVLPSTLLQRLNSNSRQSKLYQAFREVGRVMRTMFLLKFISDTPMRSHIIAETTKIESYHSFLDWLVFGGDTITTGDPIEQEKRIKYMDLVGNAIMLQNVADMTDILHQLRQEGMEITQEMVAHLSPYLTEHIKRFGDYWLDMNDLPDPLQHDKPFLAT